MAWGCQHPGRAGRRGPGGGLAHGTPDAGGSPRRQQGRSTGYTATAGSVGTPSAVARGAAVGQGGPAARSFACGAISAPARSRSAAAAAAAPPPPAHAPSPCSALPCLQPCVRQPRRHHPQVSAEHLPPVLQGVLQGHWLCEGAHPATQLGSGCRLARPLAAVAGQRGTGGLDSAARQAARGARAAGRQAAAAGACAAAAAGCATRPWGRGSAPCSWAGPLATSGSSSTKTQSSSTGCMTAGGRSLASQRSAACAACPQHAWLAGGGAGHSSSPVGTAPTAQQHLAPGARSCRHADNDPGSGCRDLQYK